MTKDNPVRELRNRLKLNQVKFAGILGRSLQSVRAYEKHPEDVPLEIAHRLESISAQYDRGELIPDATNSPKVRTGLGPAPPSKHQRWVDMLLAIMESGHDVATRAVLSNLVAFTALIEADKAKGKIGEKTRRGRSA